MAFKLNNADNYESIMVKITKAKYPILFENKVQEMIESTGLSREEAEKYVEGLKIELELYYEKHAGLFAVEAGAVDSFCEITSPYTKEVGEPFEDN